MLKGCFFAEWPQAFMPGKNVGNPWWCNCRNKASGHILPTSDWIILKQSLLSSLISKTSWIKYLHTDTTRVHTEAPQWWGNTDVPGGFFSHSHIWAYFRQSSVSFANAWSLISPNTFLSGLRSLQTLIRHWWCILSDGLEQDETG